MTMKKTMMMRMKRALMTQSQPRSRPVEVARNRLKVAVKEDK